MTQLEQYVEKGILKGILKGRTEGIQTGIQKEKFQTVQNLLSANCRWDLITKVTGITEKQFQEWEKQEAEPHSSKK